MNRDKQGRFVSGHRHNKNTLDKMKYSLKGRVAWNKGNIKYIFICKNCKIEFKISDKRRKYCSIKCVIRNGFKKGHKTWNKNKKMPLRKWEDAKLLINSAGYMVKSIGNKLIYEHHYIYCKNKNLKKIPSGYLIHHIDGNKINNKINNLELMSRKDHINHHRKTKL